MPTAHSDFAMLSTNGTRLDAIEQFTSCDPANHSTSPNRPIQSPRVAGLPPASSNRHAAPPLTSDTASCTMRLARAADSAWESRSLRRFVAGLHDPQGNESGLLGAHQQLGENLARHTLDRSDCLRMDSPESLTQRMEGGSEGESSGYEQQRHVDTCTGSDPMVMESQQDSVGNAHVSARSVISPRSTEQSREQSSISIVGDIYSGVSTSPRRLSPKSPSVSNGTPVKHSSPGSGKAPTPKPQKFVHYH